MGPVGWSGWLSQTSPIPRSPDGDKKIDPKVPNRPFCLATNGSLTKSGVLWQIMDFGAKIRIFWPKETFTSRSKQCSNHNEKKFQKAPGVLVICPFDEKARSKTRNWLMVQNIKILGSKLHFSLPSGPLEPRWSIFWTRNRCLVGSPVWGYQKFGFLPSKIGLLAHKWPNLT